MSSRRSLRSVMGKGPVMSERKSLAQLQAELEDADKLAPSGSRWRHLKSDTDYLVTGHCVLEATGKAAIMYTPMKGPADFAFARDSDEFLDGRFLRLPKGGE